MGLKQEGFFEKRFAEIWASVELIGSTTIEVERRLLIERIVDIYETDSLHRFGGPKEPTSLIDSIAIFEAEFIFSKMKAMIRDLDTKGMAMNKIESAIITRLANRLNISDDEAIQLYIEQSNQILSFPGH